MLWEVLREFEGLPIFSEQTNLYKFICVISNGLIYIYHRNSCIIKSMEIV